MAAAFRGALIGQECEAHEKAAGLRTRMTVSLAAAVFTLIALIALGLMTISASEDDAPAS